MYHKSFGRLWLLAITALLPALAQAQLTVTENFNGSSTQNTWSALNGACLTASTAYATSSTVPPGTIPGCTKSGGASNYYYGNLGSTQVGGYSGSLPDSTGQGALRLTNGALTNGSSNSHDQSGAIVSTTPFPSNQGLQITFNTVTYGGNYANGTGADGMSFFLADAAAYSQQTGTSATNGSITYYQVLTGDSGGSLGYDCASQKTGNGMVGAYIGLGIDEYGNFVNSGDNGASSDANSAGFSPNTVGLRGAGNITSSLFPNAGGKLAAGLITSTQAVCQYGFYTTSANGSNSSNSNNSQGLSVGTITSVTPNGSYTSAVIGVVTSVSYGFYSTTQITTATYPITKVLDYPILGYSVLPSANLIPNQEATSTSNTSPLPSRLAATPISYSLSLTKTGLLTLTYSYNGGIATPVITQNITGSGKINNGTLPTNFL